MRARRWCCRDVSADVVDVGSVILPHEEKLAAVAEDGGADAAFFETRVLLHDGDVPAVELPHLRVALLHDLLAAGDVEQARDFLIDVPFPQRARHGDDVLARVVGDEESGDGAEQLCGLGDVAEFKVRDLSGERDGRCTVEKAAINALGTPRQQAIRKFPHVVASSVELHQLLEHSMSGIIAVC